MSVTTVDIGLSILRAILDEPDDDTHRLVYADWLEERGEMGRSSYIRWWLASPDDVTCLDYPDCGDMTHTFATGHQFRATIPAGCEGCVWGRGFICSVRLPLQQWLDHGPALVRAHPLRKVVISDTRQDYCDGSGGHTEGWFNLFGNPPPEDIHEWFAGPPFTSPHYDTFCLHADFGSRRHESKEAAAAFLGTAALAWAKGREAQTD